MSVDLKTYFFRLEPEARETFARRCGTTRGHMQNIAYGYREPSTELAVAIERESGGACGRRDMFPDTYPAKWPELSPTVATTAGEAIAHQGANVQRLRAGTLSKEATDV